MCFEPTHNTYKENKKKMLKNIHNFFRKEQKGKKKYCGNDASSSVLCLCCHLSTPAVGTPPTAPRPRGNICFGKLSYTFIIGTRPKNKIYIIQIFMSFPNMCIFISIT